MDENIALLLNLTDIKTQRDIGRWHYSLTMYMLSIYSKYENQTLEIPFSHFTVLTSIESILCLAALTSPDPKCLFDSVRSAVRSWN